MDDGSRVVEVVLPNGATGLVMVRELDGGGADKVGWQNRFDFAGVSETLEGVADALQASMAKAHPTKVTVALGVELAVKAGKLTALIVEGDAKATLTVTLEWGSSDEPTAKGP
jgi:hypothetical protein